MSSLVSMSRIEADGPHAGVCAWRLNLLERKSGERCILGAIPQTRCVLDLTTAIPLVRESVVAVFRYQQTRPAAVKKGGKVRPAQFRGGWGSGLCVVANRYVVTAYHVLNEGKPRDPNDHFVVLAVPGNGDSAFHFPVIGFPLERQDCDLAILEIGPPAIAGINVPAFPVSFAPLMDGSRVLTVGFPAPEITGVNIDAAGVFHGGQFFLKSHANEGIVSGQYPISGLHAYEFNVGWHVGESGGPVVRLADPVAAVTLMQHYRNVNTPHGIMPGPHRGCALTQIQTDLVRLGATVV